MWIAWGLGNEGNAPGLICFVLGSWTGYLTSLPSIPVKCLSSVFPSHYQHVTKISCRVAASLRFPTALAPPGHIATCPWYLQWPACSFPTPKHFAFLMCGFTQGLFLGKVGKSLTVYCLDLYHTTTDEILLYHLVICAYHFLIDTVKFFLPS